MAQIPQFVGVVILVVIALALFLMTRRRGESLPEATLSLPAPQPRIPTIEVDERPETALPRRPEPPPLPDQSLKREVEELVERQPEEIAQLLRGWLADQRTA